MDANSNRPIIIKRKKVIAGGHHGGAWKVAYADFVTAMMAFFLLMWLLSSASEEQRSGIADYFSPSIPIMRVSGGGDGALAGNEIFETDTLSQTETGGAAELEGQGVSFGSESQAAEEAALEELESTLLGMGGETLLTENALQHIVTRLTDEGLVIEIFDLPGAPLFVDQTDAPLPVTQEIFTVLTEVLQIVRNEVAISGHVSARPLLRIDYSEWDLSTSRAARVRLLIEAAGLAPRRVVRLTGEADRANTDPDPAAVRNNRIELVVLRSDQ